MFNRESIATKWATNNRTLHNKQTWQHLLRRNRMFPKRLSSSSSFSFSSWVVSCHLLHAVCCMCMCLVFSSVFSTSQVSKSYTKVRRNKKCVFECLYRSRSLFLCVLKNRRKTWKNITKHEEKTRKYMINREMLWKNMKKHDKFVKSGRKQICRKNVWKYVENML